MPELTLATKFTAVGAKDVVSAIDAIREAVDGLSKNSAKVAKAAKAFTDFSKAEAKATQTTKKFGQETDNATKKTGKFGEALNKLKGDLDGVVNAGKGIAKIGSDMIRMASFPVKEAADFQQGMQNVKAVMSDVTEEGFAKMSAEARKMGETTAATATQASEALQFLAMAGLDADEATTALAGTLQLAQAGNISMAKAADISTNVLAGLGLEVSELGRVVDVMAVAAAKSNQNVAELGNAMKIAGPAAKGTATSMEDMVAVLGGLADNGIKGSTAGHAVKRMLLSLMAPTAKATDQLREMGIELKDSGGKFKGLVPILKEMQTQWDGNANALAESNEIFGKFTSTAAVAAAGSTKDIDGMTKALDNAAGAGKKMADVRLDSFWGQITLLKSKISSLLIDAGLPLLDILKEWVKWFTVGVDWIQTTMKYFGDLSPVIIGLVGVIGGLAVALGTAVSAFGTLAIAITTVTAIMNTSGAVAMLSYIKNLSLIRPAALAATKGLAFLTGGITATGAAIAATTLLITAGVGAIVAATYHAWKWYEASEAAAASQKRLVDASSELITKFREFGETDFSKIDITKLTREGVKTLSTDLQKAKVYWLAMKNVAETKGDQEAISNATNKLKELQGVLKTISEQTTLEKPKEAIKATIVEMEAFKKSAKEAYNQAIESAQKYADKAIEFAEKIKQANMTTEQKVAEFRRQGLTDEEKAVSRKKEIETTLVKMKEASAKHDYETAERLVKHAESLQVANMQGQGKVTEQQIQDYKEIRDAYNSQVFEPQKQANTEMAEGATQAAKTIKEQLATISDGLVANVKIELSNLEAMEATLDEQFSKIEPEIDFSKTSQQAVADITKSLQESDQKVEMPISADMMDFERKLAELKEKRTVHKIIGGEWVEIPVNADDDQAKRDLEELHREASKPATKIVTVVTREAKAAGGFAGELVGAASEMKLAMGKILPGFGGGDTIKALLEPGEGIIPKQRVKQYGRGFIQSIINGTLVAPKYPVVKLAAGGVVDNNNRHARSTGSDGLLGVKDLGMMRLPVGDRSYSIISKPNILKSLEKALTREVSAGAM